MECIEEDEAKKIILEEALATAVSAENMQSLLKLNIVPDAIDLEDPTVQQQIETHTAGQDRIQDPLVVGESLDFTDQELMDNPRPLLWFQIEEGDPVHKIEPGNLHTFQKFLSDPALKKYHDGYEEYIQHYFDA